MWGLNYIDELVCFMKDTNNSGNFGNGGDFRGYVVTDRNVSVISMVDDDFGASNGSRLQYHTRYDAYGEARCEPQGVVDGDGGVDTCDEGAINMLSTKSLLDPAYDTVCYTIRNGTINSYDKAIATNALGKNCILRITHGSKNDGV